MPEMVERKTVNANLPKKRNAPMVCEYLPYSGREAFKRLRTNVMISMTEQPEKKCRVLGVTSSQPSEGKSAVAANLAYAFAELNASVLLIDADMRKPSIHEKLGAQMVPGLSDVLTGKENLNGVIVCYGSTKDNTKFDLLTSGAESDHPIELLTSRRFRSLLEVVSKAYDYVIVDLPPVGPVSDAVTVAKNMDGIVMVVRENICPRSVLVECVEQLRYAKANIVGFVMNGCVEGSGKRNQYYTYRK